MDSDISLNGCSNQVEDSNHSIQLWRSIKGYEILHMMKKGQIKKVEPVRCGGSLRCSNWR